MPQILNPDKTHKACKKNALRTVEKASYLLKHLCDMKNDNCPALDNVDMSNLIHIDHELCELRRVLNNDRKSN